MTAEQPANPQKWPGNRPPVTNPEFLSQRMDAAWGRGKYRKEVWDDKVNPLNDWWTAYAPTQEEMAAAREGFDFSDPKGWLEVHYCPITDAEFQMHYIFDARNNV